MPAFAARLAFGEMADGLLLASTRVEPKRLMDAGFRFRFPELEGALVCMLSDHKDTSWDARTRSQSFLLIWGGGGPPPPPPPPPPPRWLPQLDIRS